MTQGQSSKERTCLAVYTTSLGVLSVGVSRSKWTSQSLSMMLAILHMYSTCRNKHMNCLDVYLVIGMDAQSLPHPCNCSAICAPIIYILMINIRKPFMRLTTGEGIQQCLMPIN